MFKGHRSFDKLTPKAHYPRIITSPSPTPRRSQKDAVSLKIDKLPKFDFIDHILLKYYKKKGYKENVKIESDLIRSSKTVEGFHSKISEIQKLSSSRKFNALDSGFIIDKGRKEFFSPKNFEEKKNIHIGKKKKINLLDFKHRILVRLTLMQEEHASGRMECSDLKFPMKFFSLSERENLVVYLDFNKIPSIKEHFMRRQRKEFFVEIDEKKLEKVKGKLRYIGFLFISKGGSTDSYIGCAFKGFKKFNKNARQLRARKKEVMKRYKQNVLKYGIDYSYFLEDEEKKKKKNRKNLKDIGLEKVKKNKKVFVEKFSSPDEYNRKKIMKYKDGVRKEMEKISIVNKRKKYIYEEKMHELRNRKSRNQLCKEKKLLKIAGLLEDSVKRCHQEIWLKFIFSVMLIKKFKNGIKEYRVKVERRKRMEKINMIMLKFILPLKRAKKPKRDGDLMRVKQ